MKTYKQFKENNTCKMGEYFCNTDQKCKPIPSGYKVDDNGILVKEDGMGAGAVGAPTNNAGGGNIAGIGVGPAGEPGIVGQGFGKRRKKDKAILGLIKRNIKENYDNNNVILKQVLDGLDKVDVVIDTMNNTKSEIKIVKEQKKKSFKERYNVR
jgi:hypothetical protein